MSTQPEDFIPPKKIFSLVEPPPRVYKLPPDFKKSKSVSRLNIKDCEPTIGLDDGLKHRYRYFYRPYRENTQKGVNNSVKYDFENVEWMNVADIIINKKQQEFLDIIEFYRENHNVGYGDGVANFDSRSLKSQQKRK